MTPLVAFLMTTLGKWIAGGAALFGVLIVGWFKARAAGAKAERDKQIAAEHAARDIADQIDDAVAGRAPVTNREELKKWQRKP